VNSPRKLLNVGPKSAAWLRQVGIRSEDDLRAIGSVAAFMKVKRAGFRPSLNLLYALEGALIDCHWQQLPAGRRSELLLEVDAIDASVPLPKGRAAGPVIDCDVPRSEDDDAAPSLCFDDPIDEPGQE